MTKSIPLFYPNVTRKMQDAAWSALGEKFIGQGENVNKFERKLEKNLKVKNLLTLNNCTSALELAYHMLGLSAGDEVISPVFTCTATNIPLVRRGVKIIFADVKENLLLDWDDVQRKITPKTKAIINTHLFNQINESRDLGVSVIGDSAQYLDKTKGEKFTCYSFQAVKIITTVDGGALVCKERKDYNRAKLLRWYGINRESGKNNIDVDIEEAGFKYHMNNVTAAIGIAALKDLSKVKLKIEKIQNIYRDLLKNITGLKIVGGSPFLIHIKNRDQLMKMLAKQGIETGLVHKRNDMYTVFGGKRLNLPNMNRLENTYLLLPCHNHMTTQDVEFICKAIKK